MLDSNTSGAIQLMLPATKSAEFTTVTVDQLILRMYITHSMTTLCTALNYVDEEN